MAHSHSHSHGGGLKNTPVHVLYICLVINLLFVVAEALAGWQSNSTGLLSDAGHNLGDALGLLLSLIAIYLDRSKGNISKSVSKYITLANGLLLLGAVALIVFESVGKIINPHEVNAHTVIIVSAAAIVVNGLTAWLLMNIAYLYDELFGVEPAPQSSIQPKSRERSLVPSFMFSICENKSSCLSSEGAK